MLHIILSFLLFITITCPNFPTLSNGDRNFNKVQLWNGRYPCNTKVTFSCNSGYILNASGAGQGSSSACETTGYWSHKLPRCNKSKCYQHL